MLRRIATRHAYTVWSSVLLAARHARSVYIQIIKYTFYMTNLTFQKEGSQFHWMYDLINEFYTQPYTVSLSLSLSAPKLNISSRIF